MATRPRVSCSPSHVCWLALTSWVLPGLACAEQVEFNPAFLASSGLDISRFSQAGYMVPGDYPVELIVNQQSVGRHLLRVEEDSNDTQSTRLALSAWQVVGLDPEILQDLEQRCSGLAADDCYLDATSVAPGVTLTLDQGTLSARVSVPQALMLQRPRGYVESEHWTAGEAALLTNYHLNSYRSSISGEDFDSTFLGASIAANLGLWQYRSDFNVTRDDQGRVDWDSLHHYVQRPLAGQERLLRLGEVNTRGELFDSIPVLGATLTSEPRMLPDSQRGYAPVVTGTAQTQAKVTITQQGKHLLETSVPPGPFVIDDLYPTGYGGDLDVQVTEADGRIERYSVPYAALPGLLRPGHSRLYLAAGELNNDAIGDAPLLAEIGYRRGLSNALTGYTGVQASEDYWSPLIGAAFNTRYGAVGVDAQYSDARLPDGNRHGWSLQTSYSRHLIGSDTDINLAAYRYSSSGYLSLSDAAYLQDVPASSEPQQRDVDAYYSDASQRNRLQFNISQPLGERSRLSFTGSVADYWHREGSESTYQLGLTRTFGRVSLNLSLSRVESEDRDTENRALLSASLPLSNTAFAPRMTISASRDSAQNDHRNLNVTGNLGEDRGLAYGIHASQSTGDTGDQHSYGANLSTHTSVGQYTLSGSESDDYRQLSFGASGAVLLHRHGVTFGQSTGDTVGLIRAEGGAGARVTNAANLTLDSDGEALVPFLSPYRVNDVQLDPRGASTAVEFQRTNVQVSPYAGAMVPIHFATDTGQPVVLVLTQHGRGVPLGSTATAADGRVLGQVGAGGMLLVRDLAPGSPLTISLDQGRHCQAQPEWTPPAMGSDDIPIVESPCIGPSSDHTKDPS
ncbi:MULTISPECIES: fimbria/pilus outer membrane usher protein [Halomonas]|uniref:fimbria/pilus outer membrane usher protein n=1 Tax=Halomonas TaxID=2745 RepID=UPI001C972DD2|nr:MULTISPECIES: fimbria/pilus outer membrane usher protein [Halomonas]MBY5924132.1 fimbrial biogenesis outer membrane usher protein [Halomonas sp. DP4Y7-2]MBY5967166.1 fimbrial biogenesis outer membrane usher protein [Halomonas denitrificans]MBY6231174.1 fimbrial biogenesis outer membrane usher protein [Halomonas sp. DP4Y7-1]